MIEQADISEELPQIRLTCLPDLFGAEELRLADPLLVVGRNTSVASDAPRACLEC